MAATRSSRKGKQPDTPTGWLETFQRGECTRTEAASNMRRLAAGDKRRLQAWLMALDSATRGTSSSAPVAGPSHAANQLGEEEEASDMEHSDDQSSNVAPPPQTADAPFTSAQLALLKTMLHRVVASQPTVTVERQRGRRVAEVESPERPARR
jgi:hypothetical protein